MAHHVCSSHAICLAPPPADPSRAARAAAPEKGVPRGVGIGSGPGSGPKQAAGRDGAGLEHKAEGSTEAGEAEFEIGREE
jgi:hypothetical protein